MSKMKWVAVLASLTMVSTACAEKATRPRLDTTAGAPAEVRLRRPAADYSAEVPLAYADLSLTFTRRTAGFTGPVQARAFAYTSIALYESMVAGMPHHRSMASRLHGIGALPSPRGMPLEWPLVANAALAEVMRGLWGGATNRAAENVAALDSLEARFAAQYGAQVPPGIARLSATYGRAVGAAVFATSKDDGAHESYLTNFPPYTPPTGPGKWELLPGQQAVQPFWGERVHPFALASVQQCDQGGPPAYSEQAGSPFHQEVMEVYEMVKAPTPERTAIARFWADGGGSYGGPGHTLAIVSQLLRQRQANLEVAAETYARVMISDADAMTAAWWAKYHYGLLRPITYVRRVIGDAAWTPIVGTPPFPEYPSTHATQSAAAMAALEQLMGTNVPFVDRTYEADGMGTRSFPRLFAAAEEAGMSRLYAGIHFRSANDDGRALGTCVA
ncbi:MAG TPA: vanadium-dependent haloperoxidase, partial [Gemmatimonadaceae bacterium]|nr:vanadium-dependent haloperoxidase [Gemmatimonadaceae bacterium]